MKKEANNLESADLSVDENTGLIEHNYKNLIKVKDLLDSTGPGFCLAKWKQVTMHLGTGMTHSCHHPSPHKIPIEEIEKDPGALHNTEFKKEQRRLMKNGEKPSECDYCWRVEKDGHFSDRHFKSLEPWAVYHHDDILEDDSDDVYPSYLEVSFSNICNMKCTYCGPEFSSQWVHELKTQGPVKVLDGTNAVQWSHGYQDLDSLSYKNREFNPYIDAFWKWFPKAYKHLHTYRITGGEPLMTEETFKSIDFFIENPNTELEFSINSNLCVPDKLWNRFVDKVQELTSKKVVKKFAVFTSIEGWGESAEYARTGMDFELFKSRVEQLAAMPEVRVIIMSAFNIFSLTSFQSMLEWVYDLKMKYNPCALLAGVELEHGYKLNSNEYTEDYTDRGDSCESHAWKIGLDIPYLRNPEFLDVQYATPELIQDYLIPCMNYMATKQASDLWQPHQGFESYEVEKLKRIVNHCINYVDYYQPTIISNNHEDIEELEEHVIIARAKFYDFIHAMDQRRNTVFLDQFNGMDDFYQHAELCKERVGFLHDNNFL